MGAGEQRPPESGKSKEGRNMEVQRSPSRRTAGGRRRTKRRHLSRTQRRRLLSLLREREETLPDLSSSGIYSRPGKIRGKGRAPFPPPTTKWHGGLPQVYSVCGMFTQGNGADPLGIPCCQMSPNRTIVIMPQQQYMQAYIKACLDLSL